MIVPDASMARPTKWANRTRPTAPASTARSTPDSRALSVSSAALNGTGMVFTS